LALTYAERVGAGGSAQAIYRARYRAWRERTRRAWLLAILPMPLLTLGAAFAFPADRWFLVGLGVGATVTLALATVLFVPEHIDRWRRGAEAERQTAKQLRALVRAGWVVEHDLPGRSGNSDHVAVAPSGAAFLLDTKAPGGEVSVRGGVLHVRWLEDPDDGYEVRLGPRMRAAAAALSADLAKALPRRPWVTPVLVVWGRWAGPPQHHDGVLWVPGSMLAEQLRARSGEAAPRTQGDVAAALREHARKARSGSASRFGSARPGLTDS
jgi:hypothetical protein